MTPLQVARTIGGIASGGIFERPHLVSDGELKEMGADPPIQSISRFSLSPTTVSAVTSGMWGVVNEGGGTGAGARCAGLDIGGKTGTAQVVSVSLQDSAHSAQYRNNAWFVGISPSQNPEIAVAVLVMRGEHSSVAAPIAADVIKAYYQEKQANAPSLTQVRSKAASPTPGALLSLPGSKPESNVASEIH